MTPQSPEAKLAQAARETFVPTLAPSLVNERERLASQRVGSTVRGWRLVRMLGTGPLTAAYEALRGPGDSGERGVVKLMLGELSRDERARRSFLRGAYAANRFEHPRVVPVLADGTDADGAPFVVRAWCEAEPLSTLVGTTKLSAKRVLRIAEQLLDVLENAHAHGIVHGAIAPCNLLVTPRGSIRVVDFAAAPEMGARAAEDDESIAATRAGPFVPPERRTSPRAPVNESCDVWSVAACIHFAIIGRPPTEVRDDVAWVGLERLAKIVEHGLETEPAQRYDSAYAMLGDVRRVMADRAPKLGDARRPVPTGSARVNETAPRTTARLPPSLPDAGSAGDTEGSAQWKGNVLLILAIAMLVGIATFVMVREKVEEERLEEPRVPSLLAEPVRSPRV